MWPKLFPTLLILLDLCAMFGYWGDWRKMVYWGSACCLTYVVTF